MKRRFEVEVECNYGSLGTAILEIDQKVFDNVDDSFRENFYNLRTPQEIVKHLAYNIFVNETNLSQLDGWANLTDDLIKVIEYPSQIKWDFEVKELESENG